MNDLRDFYEGWKPRPIKAEVPTPEQSAKFLNFIKSLKPWAVNFWLKQLGKPHKQRVAESYKYALEQMTLGNVQTIYHMTAMMTPEEIRAFKILYTGSPDKDLLFYASALLCFRERFMFASAVLNSVKE